MCNNTWPTIPKEVNSVVFQKRNSLTNDVTDAGLVHLKEPTNLETVSLIGTQVTDAGLVHLAELTSLTSLTLARTQIADAGTLIQTEGGVNENGSCPLNVS
ncbi:MAG: hypothetical protein VX346_09745 [Planctomycetota bacterium]|nr:hypothetical protein [Planctomycetota bacterium]